MAGYSIKKIDEMEAVYANSFKRARAELGVEAFGMQVVDMPPDADQYPEHDHANDGQEEVYVTLHGTGEIEIEGERHRLDRDTMVRVGPGVKRKVWTGGDALRLLIVGGVPGEVYDPPEVTMLGAPDPLKQAQAQS
jgi:mannose-6-phosphate isomerase-like protein (cupin superfamily)